MSDLTSDEILFIISRVIANAQASKEELEKNKNDFNTGKMLTYYEILDTIKNELIARNFDSKKLGLDFDLEKFFFG